MSEPEGGDDGTFLGAALAETRSRAGRVPGWMVEHAALGELPPDAAREVDAAAPGAVAARRETLLGEVRRVIRAGRPVRYRRPAPRPRWIPLAFVAAAALSAAAGLAVGVRVSEPTGAVLKGGPEAGVPQLHVDAGSRRWTATPNGFAYQVSVASGPVRLSVDAPDGSRAWAYVATASGPVGLSGSPGPTGIGARGVEWEVPAGAETAVVVLFLPDGRDPAQAARDYGDGLIEPQPTSGARAIVLRLRAAGP